MLPLTDHAKEQLNGYLTAIKQLEARLDGFVSGLLAANGLDPKTYHLNVTKGCLEPINAPAPPPETPAPPPPAAG